MKLRELLDGYVAGNGIKRQAVAKEANVDDKALLRFLRTGKISDLNVTRLVTWAIDEHAVGLLWLGGLIGCLYLCGCDASIATTSTTSLDTPTESTQIMLSAPGESSCHVSLVTVGGYRFAVVQNQQHVGICEVTEKNVRTPSEK